MNKIDIFFINNSFKNNIKFFELVDTNAIIKINIFGLTNYQLVKEINRINDIIKLHEKNSSKIKRINIVFSKQIDTFTTNKILTKINDVLYSYYPITKEIKLYNVNNTKQVIPISLESSGLMDELIRYKNIVMDPNKTPESYLAYVQSNIPDSYNIKITNTSETKLFPLTRAVGSGSTSSSYFVHISPKIEKPENKNIYLLGKAVTYDSGGLNLKHVLMDEMKIDMTGSAIILSVLKLLKENGFDTNLNIHLIMPIVENMIGSGGLKPGNVIKSMGNKLVEVVNTDAEGRLCLVDSIDYVNLFLLQDKNPDNCLIIDIATLTGNTLHITSGISCLAMCNDKAIGQTDKLINIGENIGEYVDFLKIRKEYLDMLTSNVADIKNINTSEKAGCIIAGTFLHYFVDDNVPWIHLDLGVSTFVDSVAISYGINLLYEFIKQIK